MEWPEMMWLDNEEVSCCSSIVLDFLGVSYLDPFYYPPETKKIIPSTFMVSKMIHFLSKWSQKSGHIPWFSGEYPCTSYFAQLKIWIQAAQPGAWLGHHEDWVAWPRWDQNGWGLQGLKKNSRVVCCSKRVETNRDNRDLKRISSNVIAFFSSELQTFTYI